MRLDGWQRIGIVLSIVWIFVGAYLGREAAARDRLAGYNYCHLIGDPLVLIDPNLWGSMIDSCEDNYWVFLAFVPVPFIYGIILATRWVVGGFRQKK